MLEELIPINLSSQGGGGGKGGRWGKGKLLLLAAPSLGIIRIFICFSGGQFHPPGFISTIRQWSWIFPWNFDWKLGAIDGIDGIDGIGGPSGWGLPTASHRRGIESMRRVRNNCWLMMQYLGHAAIIPLIYLLVGLGWLGLAWVGLGWLGLAWGSVGRFLPGRGRAGGVRFDHVIARSRYLISKDAALATDVFEGWLNASGWCWKKPIDSGPIVLSDRFKRLRFRHSDPGPVCVCVCVCASVCLSVIKPVFIISIAGWWFIAIFTARSAFSETGKWQLLASFSV